MQPKYAILFQPEQEDISTSQHFAQLLESFLAPLLLILIKCWINGWCARWCSVVLPSCASGIANKDSY